MQTGGKGSKIKDTRGAVGVTDSEESEVEPLPVQQPEVVVEDAPASRRPQRRPQRVRRERSPEAQSEPETDVEPAPAPEEGEGAQATPKGWPRSQHLEPPRSTPRTPDIRPLSVPKVSTNGKRSTRKRRRAEDEAGVVGDPGQYSHEDAQLREGVAEGLASPTNEFVFRRKRIRH